MEDNYNPLVAPLHMNLWKSGIKKKTFMLLNLQLYELNLTGLLIHWLVIL